MSDATDLLAESSSDGGKVRGVVALRISVPAESLNEVTTGGDGFPSGAPAAESLTEVSCGELLDSDIVLGAQMEEADDDNIQIVSAQRSGSGKVKLLWDNPSANDDEKIDAATTVHVWILVARK